MCPPDSAQPRPRGEAGDGARQGADIIGDGLPGVEPPAPAPLAVSAREAARLVNVSARHWAGLVARGRAPAGVRLGRRRVWPLEELRGWLAAGAPSREHWEGRP